MKILVINAGSTSVKFKHFNETMESSIGGKIDSKEGEYVFSLHKKSESFSWEISEADFARAGELILKELSAEKIDRIGFRIVHGAEKFSEPTLLTTEVLAELETLNELAPLHNPPALARIQEFARLLPETPLYGVFDTAFHSHMPQKAYLYALPYAFYENYHLRRFGFHGISHKFVFSQLSKLESKTAKVISCHLGGGASITAIENGKSVDTSMGFTPLEGLIMSTRPGDIDDGALYYLMGKLHMSVQDMQNIENHHSGLLGISGSSGDMRQLLQLEAAGDKRAALAIEMYVHRAQKYIGAYAATLGGVDSLIFTAGVGEGSDVIRKRIVSGLDFLNLAIDDTLNDGKIDLQDNLKISKASSNPIWVIPTNEELQIAREISKV